MAGIAERVKDTTTSTGTGSITLANSAPSGFRTFAAAFGAAPVRVRYVIVGGSQWEAGTGVFNGTTGLTRGAVESSSNAGALVNFSAGTKDVFCSALSPDLAAGSVGRTIGVNRASYFAP